MWMVAVTAPTQTVLDLWQHQAQRRSSQLAVMRIPTQRMMALAPIPALQAPTTILCIAHRAMQCAHIYVHLLLFAACMFMILLYLISACCAFAWYLQNCGVDM